MEDTTGIPEKILIEKEKKNDDNNSSDFENVFDEDTLTSLNAQERHTGGGYKTDFGKEVPTLSFESAYTFV